MAGYKPKSLEEFNSIFNATLSAEEAIARGTSKIKEGIEADSAEETEVVSSDTETEKPEAEIEDVSVSVDDFIKSFMAEMPETVRRPSIAPVAFVKEEATEEKELPEEVKEEPEQIQEKEEAEPEAETTASEQVSGDISEWARIMGDLDDEESNKPRKYGKKRKNKKGKKAEGSEEAVSEEAVEEEVSEAEPEEEEKEPEDVFDTLLEDYEESTQKRVKAQKSFKGRKPLRVICSLLLVLSISVTVFVGALNLVFNVNTGKAAPGGYVLFTAAYDFAQVGVEAEDLVVCKEGSLVKGQYAAYIDTQNKTFCFGIREDGIVDENGVSYEIISGQPIRTEDVVGPIEKTYSDVGGYVSLIFENYIIILSALFALTVVLAVVVIFVLRNKNKKDKAEDEEVENGESEEEADEEDSDESGNSDDDDDSASLFSDLD
ncbi:MAG: hypothetical protein IJ262_10845 [Clostridia bacterium]|nr:hypothetical protein [Clostridia bacterium]MBQ8029887.1 hypothetical protein [Clostridia bacterium]